MTIQRILSVDFDGTLCVEAYPEIGRRLLIHRLVAWYVRSQHRRGVKIIINTLRDKDNDVIGPEPYILMTLKLQDWRIPYDEINDNLPELTKKYGYARKISATRYLDDRNVGVVGWLLRMFNR